MFGFFKAVLRDGQVVGLADRAFDGLSKGNMSDVEKVFMKLSKLPFEEVQSSLLEGVKVATQEGDIEDILAGMTGDMPDESLELLTLTWKDDVDEIMRRMDNNQGTFIGTFAYLVGALNDSHKRRNGKAA